MTHSHTHSETEPKNLWLSGIAAAGFILLFLLIIWLAYLPTMPPPVDAALRAEQEAKLADTRAKAARLLEGYAVVNPQEGVYRIPIADAMEKTVVDLQTR
jgi:hypothetical protein